MASAADDTRQWFGIGAIDDHVVFGYGTQAEAVRFMGLLNDQHGDYDPYIMIAPLPPEQAAAMDLAHCDGTYDMRQIIQEHQIMDG
jgi:hypothetical protein